MHLPYDRAQHTLIFLHLQKTGGSTLGRIIDRHYPSSQLYLLESGNDSEVLEFAALSEVQRARIKMLRGVVPFGIHQYIPHETRYFTLIRNPIDRVVSNFMFLQRKGKPGVKVDYTQRKRTIEKWLEQSPFQFNVQVRTILGGSTRSEALKQALPPDALDQAKNILKKHFSLVGVTDYFDEALLLMQQRFGWDKLYYVKRLVSPKEQREKITPEQRAWIAEHCTLDMELYEWAKREFEAVMKDQPPRFKTDLEQLAAASARYSRFYNTTARIRQSALYKRFRQTFWPGWTPWTPESDD